MVRDGFSCNLVWAYYLAGRYQDAMTTLEARTAIANWLKSFPHVSIGYMALEAITGPGSRDGLIT